MRQLAIIIPAYKTTFLRETLDSIAAQTDKRFHLYIGDDASPHDIAAIVEEYRDKIPLTYRRFEKNFGGHDLVAHWARCIEMSEGEPWLWLFSDDDTMDCRCVEAFYRMSEKVRSDALVHFDLRIINSRKEIVEVVEKPPYPARQTAAEYLLNKLHGRVISYVVEFVFPRSKYEEIGGFVNFDLAWGSDFITWLKLASICSYGIVSIAPDGNNRVNWRSSNENISPQVSHPILIRKIKSLIRNAEYVKKELMQNSIRYSPLKMSFRLVRFPLGEMYRHAATLSVQDLCELTRYYQKVVGYAVPAMGVMIVAGLKGYWSRMEKKLWYN